MGSGICLGADGVVYGRSIVVRPHREKKARRNEKVWRKLEILPFVHGSFPTTEEASSATFMFSHMFT
jgi:hypothetical protein